MHVSIYISLEDLYPNTIVTNHAGNELPDGLTPDMIRNGGADWRKYTEWFTSVKPNILIEKGEELFARALEAESDPAIRRNIERSMIQVEVLKSFWRYRVIRNHGENLKKVLAGVLGTEDDKAIGSICGAALGGEEEAYSEENSKLQKKMSELGVYFLSEGNNMQTKETFRFDLPVTRW